MTKTIEAPPPRFDASSVFGRLLDPEPGHCSIRPAGRSSVERRYVDGTMVVETGFRCDTGELRVTDGLLLGPGERRHEIGYGSPHVLVRQLEVLGGRVEVEVELVPRLEYGLVTPMPASTAAGLDIIGGADRLLLAGDRDLEIDGFRGTGRFILSAGERATFALHHRSSTDPPTTSLDGAAALQDTVAAWQSWSAEHQGCQGPYRDRVRRSALLLQTLTYQPNGAVVAAATTSRPEEIGGEHDLTEHTLDDLAGYAGSRPVRVGNDAWSQKQLDVLGEVFECAWILHEQFGELSPPTAQFLVSVADRAADTWKEPDAGIWEGRAGDRDYLTSKLMCWVALDRAVKLAAQMDAPGGKVERWEAVREEIRTAVLDRGWSDSVPGFTGSFDSDHLDAGVLLMPLMGFLPGDDERIVATLDAMEQQLSTDALVQRWTGAGNEGAFIICSYWLAAGRAMAGQADRAREIFESVTGHANDLGLLSEEIDIHERVLIGNFPQALSHIGRIGAPWAIAQAEAPGRQ